MKIAICDDELSYREHLLELLTEYSKQNPSIKFNFQLFSDPHELYETALQTAGYDIYFLDILMPNMNGIILGQKLREANFSGKIIYLTSSKEYALDSYQVKAWDYLLKPVDKEALFSVLDELFRLATEQDSQFLIIKTTENSVKLFFQDIMYVELIKRKLHFHLTNGTIVESTSIRTSFNEAIHHLLSDSRFILCSAGIAANMQHITMVGHDSVLFKENYQLYLPKKGCREVRSAWYDYCFNGEEFYDNL